MSDLTARSRSEELAAASSCIRTNPIKPQYDQNKLRSDLLAAIGLLERVNNLSKHARVEKSSPVDALDLLAETLYQTEQTL
jgi:hypothetical protein